MKSSRSNKADPVSGPRSDGSAAEDKIRRSLAGLQLPYTPIRPSNHEGNDEIPKSSTAASVASSIRILVVADIDLESASALSEYTLKQQQEDNKDHASREPRPIDLCIACGPFCRDEDLRAYLAGQQQLNSRRRRMQQRLGPQHTQSTGESQSSFEKASGSSADLGPLSPFFRTREQTTALEGLFTAALSQLESIVCRVVYCPGSTDPLTTMVSMPSTEAGRGGGSLRRLTPNSRNLHMQWLPLAPALGCGAVLYFDSPAAALQRNAKGRKKQHSSATEFEDARQNHREPPGPGRPELDFDRNDSSNSDDHSNSDDDDSIEEDDMALLAEQLVHKQERNKGYLPTLSRLLQVAPKPNHPIPFASEKSQSILITHYLDIARDGANDGCDRSDGKASSERSPGRKRDRKPSPQKQEHRAQVSPWPEGRKSTSNSTSTPGVRQKKSKGLRSHNDFLESRSTQELLCLEIASGSAAYHPSRLIAKGKVQVLLPGSLRERGEFCMLDLSLLPIDEDKDTDDEDSSERKVRRKQRKAKTSSVSSAGLVPDERATNAGDSVSGRRIHPPLSRSRPRFAWKVSRVDFHNLNRNP